MATGFFNVPKAVNEPVKDYAPGSPERAELQATYKKMFNEQIDIPMYINGEEVRTDKKVALTPPHDHQHVVAHHYRGDESHVQEAIDTALAAKADWARMSWEHRASIFLKAAELLAGPYRARMNAATMIAQSKNAFQGRN